MSLIEFQSPACGGFMMMPQTFRDVCAVLERDYSESGCWLPEDMDAVLEKLERRIELDRVQEEAEKKAQRERFLNFADTEPEEIEQEKERRSRISFRLRTFPLVEMLKAARRADKKVMWGVP